MPNMQQYTCPKCGSIGAGADETQYFCHKCIDRIIMEPSTNGKITEEMTITKDMYTELYNTFITDCTEIKGYTKAEAKRLFHQKGKDFIEEMIEVLWTNWSENFPVNTKGE